MRAIRASVAAAVSMLIMAGLAGCSVVSDRADAAGIAAAGFHRSLARGDAGAACDLLTPSTVEALEQDGDPCASALQDKDIPNASEVREVQVWGQAAQVVMSGDVVFLAMNDGRWTVRAAGCEPDPPEPYRCQIEGG